MQRALRLGAAGLVTVLVAAAITDEADARIRRHRRSAEPASENTSRAPYSSIVVDGNSGTVMQSSEADSPRHPASLTKMMTLYLLFERLEKGSITLATDLPTSARAAVQAPSKLGLKPGETIKVETAIRAIVTKSANDVAVMVAEAIGGDESAFANMMTEKAKTLGMQKTLYRNASGLPEPAQITTARDQAILGRALQDRFPQYYRYFSTQNFTFRGKETRNHNHLLGTVDGVDGIKTGYIRDSGFNIVTSVRRNGRHVIAVVFGGNTAEARDARVRALIDNNINVASLKRTAPPVVEGWMTAAAAAKPVKEAAAKPVKEKEQPAVAVAPQALAFSSEPDPQSSLIGSSEPIKPNAVKTFTVHAGSMRTASLSPLPPESRKLIPSPATATPASVTNIATVNVKGESNVTIKGEPLPPAAAAPLAPAPSARPNMRGTLPAKLASAGDSLPVATAAPEPAVKPRGPWLIQVGAFDTETEAKERLAAAQGKAKDQLSRADPFTERTQKGDKSMFRARFAGLEKEQAENACKNLKRSEIPCMLLKN